ncbi:MAG: peroxiredoxin family protein [Oligoflexia bacterium]|nr:peroxiredoxin family protein [Oligoflexia bacterium]
MAILKSAFILVAIFVTISSCGLALSEKEKNKKIDGEILQTPLTGTFQNIDGGEIDLSSTDGKSQILIFASETCAVCRHEAQNLVSHIAALGTPTNIKIYTLLVGSYLEDALDWREDLAVTWPVGVELGDTLFRKYCPEAQTPCVLIKNINSSQPAKIVGESSIERWMSLSGEWSY